MTTVCASTHLARALMRQDTRNRAARGEQLWETPDILSWTAWLRRQWDTLAADAPPDLPLLLERRQERLIWERVIGETSHAEGLLDRSEAARLASAAHALVRAYRIPRRGALYRVTDDATAFEAWQTAFVRLCEKEGWSPAAACEDVLPPPASKIVLAGFDELTPQQESFLAAIEVERLPMPALETRARARLFADTSEEKLAAARWAADILAREPQASIAVFAFDLGSQRAAWEEAFARDFGRPYAIATGVPLASLPLAASALAMLELLDAEIGVAAAGAILLSPYVAGHEAERYPRAAMDAQLRRAGGPSIPLRRMAKHDLCPAFHRALERWVGQRAALPAEQGPGAWARDFHQLLHAFGWPGDRRLNRDEFPVFEAWRDALAEFAALDRVVGAIPAWRARQLLTSIATETMFDSSPAQAAVQILPAADALGATFTHIWLAGAHDGVWPPAPALNPFLPVPVQRQYGVARSSSADVLRHARRWTQHLAASANELIVSASEAEKKEPRRLSALFSHLPCERVEPVAAAWSPPALDDLADQSAPAASAGAHRGGVRLFQFQAQCPFHAFAEFRLHARELEEPHLGFDKRKQGTALHGALANCWNELRDWQTLNTIGAEALREVAARAVDRVLTEEWRAETRLRIGMREVERERLIRILMNWLREERQRKPFRVLEHEQRAEVPFGGLTVSVRADRVDLLPDGRLILIDYKSSKPSTSSWKGDRITEPQLPLYAVTRDQPVAAAVFAVVQADERFFSGAAATKGLFSSRRQDPLDDSTLAQWRAALTTVAREFLEGDARVDWSRDACNFCKLAALCRKDELKQNAAGDDDGD